MVLEFLSRLEGVRQATKKNEWLARCPAHDDKTPSLSVGLGDSGSIILHCYAGCEPLDVVQSVGLELKDLFPAPRAQRVRPIRNPKTGKRIPNQKDFLKLANFIAHEGTVMTMHSEIVLTGAANEKDFVRIAEAVGNIKRVCNGL